MVGEPRQVGATLQGLETEKVPFRLAINEVPQLHRSDQLISAPNPLRRGLSAMPEQH
jgi:hypothetical protein